MIPSDVTLVRAMNAAFEVWAGDVVDGEIARHTGYDRRRTVERFVRFAEAHGVSTVAAVDESLVEDYVFALGRTKHGRVSAPAKATSHHRLASVRHFFSALTRLSIAHVDPTAAVRLSARQYAGARPLTAEEAEQLRHYSAGMRGTRAQAVIGLALAGVHTGEIIHLRRSLDVDLGAARVFANGQSKRDSRWCTLEPWALSAVGAHLHALRDRTDNRDEDLVFSGERANYHIRQSRLCTSIRSALNKAGLGGMPDVRPSSLTYYAAAQAYARTGQVEAAALAIGMQSLDSVAAVLGLVWRGDRR